LLEKVLARLDKVEKSVQAGFERLDQLQTDKKKAIEQSSIKEVVTVRLPKTPETRLEQLETDKKKEVVTASEPPSLQGKNSCDTVMISCILDLLLTIKIM
jgi:hypothetical protein